MGRHLGAFGEAQVSAQAQGEPDTFDFLGEKDIRLRSGDLSGAALTSFSKAMVDESQLQGAQALAASYDVLQDAIVPEDWPRFWRAYKTRRGTAESIAALASEVVQARSEGRPTERPSDSVGGSSTTGSSSSGNASASSGPLSSSVPPSSEQVEQARRILEADGGLTGSLPGSLSTSHIA